MTLAQWLGNLGAWSAQVAALVVVGAVVAAGLRVTLPRARLALWQTLLAVCLMLPFVQPWLPAPVTSPPAGVAGVQRGPVPVNNGAPPPIDPAPPSRSAYPAGQVVAALLALGALARLGWLGLGFVRLARLRRAAVPLGHAPDSIDRAVGLAGATATLALSDAIDGPVTFGLRRPVVLLPRGFLDLAPDFQTTVVCHELAHVRRRDWAWTLGEAFATAAFWFHPAVWWLVAEIQVSREAVIDREVVEITGARKPYLEALVYLASAGARPAMTPAIPMLRRRHLARRMRLLLSEVPMSKTRLVVSFAAIALTLALAGRYTVWAFPLTGPERAERALAADGRQTPPTPLQAGERPPRRIRDVRPIYPDIARTARVQGVVILELTIETDGTVSDVRVLRSVPLLDDAAVDAVRQWQFDHVDHRVVMATTVAFRLDDQAADEARSDWPAGLVRIRDARPVYPDEARKARVEGVVIVRLIVDTHGAVSEAKVLRSIPMLDQAALDAVRQWRFEPPDREIDMTVTVAFRLADRARADAANLATAVEDLSKRAAVIAEALASARLARERAAADAPQVSARIVPPPRLIHEVKPRYPRELVQQGLQGVVELQVVVDATGAVAEVTVVSGPEAFHQAAIDAVKQWLFEPPAAPTAVGIELTFTARGRREPAPPLFGPGSRPAPEGPGLAAIRFRVGG